ncbi:MAG: ABC transporter ATP-binding protein [Caldilineaceae bacterium]|nr:ABC transporter ATP-binding protein [Caldilineaceae bacterium]
MEYPIVRYWQLLTHYVRPLRVKVALLTLLIFGGIGLQLANPQIMRFFIDTALSSKPGEGLQPLMWAGGLFLVIALLLQVVTVAATYVGEDVGWRSTNQLRADLATHCLNLDMTFHNEQTPGAMIERIDSDVADIAVFFSQFVIRIVGNFLLIVAVLITLSFEDWRISLALLAYVVLASSGLIYMRHLAVPYWKASRQASADLFGFLEEQLAGTEDTRSSGAVGYVMRNLFRLSQVRFDRELRGRTMSILVVMAWMLFYTLGLALALVLGYVFYQQNILTMGSVFLVIYYTEVIFRPMDQISREIQNLQKAAAGIERVESLMGIKSKIGDEGQATLPSGPLRVEFRNVSFGYRADEPVLKDVSFLVEPGKVLGLLGRTGSGKTTLTRLLFRLYDPTAGAIYLAAQDSEEPLALTELSMEGLRHGIGLVTQDVQLFRASVRDNLTLFDEKISDERIMQVIDELELSDWLDRLPQGLDTELASEGTNLSAGEAQLLAFTRIFLKDPGLVVLDEASSRLDPATEHLIERAVDRLLRNRTGIIIAHRLGTVERADAIVILEGGQLVEYGERVQLVADPASRFSGLLRTGLQDVLA